MILNGMGSVLPVFSTYDPHRWVYKRVFVADGNFKADHVRQDRAAADLWLSEAGGMDPDRAAYRSFLKTAIEHLTVRSSSFLSCRSEMFIQIE